MEQVNIFKNAKFGDKFRISKPDQDMIEPYAIYLEQVDYYPHIERHKLAFIRKDGVSWIDDYRNNGKQHIFSNTDFVNYDIVSKWDDSELINENKLDSEEIYKFAIRSWCTAGNKLKDISGQYIQGYETGVRQAKNKFI